MLSCLLYGAYKRIIAANRRVAHVVAAAGFLFHYLNGPMLYNHIKNVLSVSLNKKCPSFLPSKYACLKPSDICTVEQLKSIQSRTKNTDEVKDFSNDVLIKYN